MHSDFEKGIQPLFELYREVKAIIALAEGTDPQGKTYAGPMNEMRNVLDHVMRCIEYPGKTEHEFHEAKEHLYRAGYDAYEILAMYIGKGIEDDLKDYPRDVITVILPNYYKTYRPKLSDIKTALADIRASKRLDPDVHQKSFREYLPVIRELRTIANHISTMIPELQAETLRRKHEADVKRVADQKKIDDEARDRKRARRISIAVPIVTCIAGAFLGAWGKSLFDTASATPPANIPSVEQTITPKQDSARVVN